MSSDEKSVSAIAIPIAEGRLCEHFGHAERYVVFDVDCENNEVLESRYLTPPPHQPGVLPKWLHDHGVDMVIAGGMGHRAQSLFAERGIDVLVGGQPETPQKLIQDYLDGQLQLGDNACSH